MGVTNTQGHIESFADLFSCKITVNTPELTSVANELAGLLFAEYGQKIEVLPAGESTKEIRIELIDTSVCECEHLPYMHYSILVFSDRVEIRSGGFYSMSRATSIFFDLLVSSPSEVTEGFSLIGDVLDDDIDHSKPKDSDLRIMSCNLLAEFESWTAEEELFPYLPIYRRREILFSALDVYAPTVIGFQEATLGWYEALDDYMANHPGKWSILKFDNPNKNNEEYVFSTVMYRSDLFSLVDSGMKFYSKYNNARCRCITWAVLKSVSSGKEFCFASTHWDGKGREHGFLQVGEISDFVNSFKSSMPVFTTGDFNANEKSEEFKQYLRDADIVDSRYAASKIVTNVGSWHPFTSDKISWGSCDHITATKDVTVQKYRAIWQSGIIFASDHCWIISDIKF